MKSNKKKKLKAYVCAAYTHLFFSFMLLHAVYKIISFYAKTARGAMADWLVRSRATTQEDILNFDGLGYRHDTEHSAGNQPTFIREP